MWIYRAEIYTEITARVIDSVQSDVELTEEQVREKLKEKHGDDVTIYTMLDS